MTNFSFFNQSISVYLLNTSKLFFTFVAKNKGMENIEVWKAIEGHERYEVSSFGRVKRHAFSYTLNRHGKDFLVNMPEQTCNYRDYNGRAVVTLDTKNYWLEVLVAKAFLNYGKGGYKKIIHKNGNPMDNRLSNLQIEEEIKVDEDVNWQWERDELLKLYDISEDGVVTRKRDGYVYSPCLNHKGYLGFRITVPWSEAADGRKAYRIHRLVAMTYLPNYSPNLQVNHKNGIKTDNRVENLEMVTNSENAAHAWRNLDKETRSKRMRRTRRQHKAEQEFSLFA